MKIEIYFFNLHDVMKTVVNAKFYMKRKHLNGILPLPTVFMKNKKINS